MQNPIKAAYWENVDHLIQATEEIENIRTKHPLMSLVILGLFGPAVLCFLIYFSEHGQSSVTELVSLCILYYVVLYLFKFCRPVRRWQWRKYYAKQMREKPLAVEWIFNDADVIQRGGSESSTRFAWSHFIHAIQRPNGFLLETAHKAFHWIPRDSLSSSDSYDALAQLLKQKISRYEN